MNIKIGKILVIIIIFPLLVGFETYKQFNNDIGIYQFTDFMGCTWPVPIKLNIIHDSGQSKEYLYIDNKSKVSSIEFHEKNLDNPPNKIGKAVTDKFGIKIQLVDVHEQISEYLIGSEKLDVEFSVFYKNGAAVTMSNIDRHQRDEMIRYCLAHPR